MSACLKCDRLLHDECDREQVTFGAFVVCKACFVELSSEHRIALAKYKPDILCQEWVQNALCSDATMLERKTALRQRPTDEPAGRREETKDRFAATAASLRIAAAAIVKKSVLR